MQNRYSLVHRESEEVVEFCSSRGIVFVPWYPLAAGDMAREHQIVSAAKRQGVTPAQLAIAWLLGRSPIMLPIPGTSSVVHLEENVAAAGLVFTEDEPRRRP